MGVIRSEPKTQEQGMRRLAIHIFIADTWQLLKSVPRHEVSCEHFKRYIIVGTTYELLSLQLYMFVGDFAHSCVLFQGSNSWPHDYREYRLTTPNWKHQTSWEIYELEFILLVKVLYFPILLRMLSKETLVQVTFRCCYAFPTLTDSY